MKFYGFHSGVIGDSGLVGYDAESLGKWFRTFRRNVSTPCSNCQRSNPAKGRHVPEDRSRRNIEHFAVGNWLRILSVKVLTSTVHIAGTAAFVATMLGHQHL